MADRPARVFISYAHDDSDHVKAVRELWSFLRSVGVDARLDLMATTQRRSLPDWMREEIREADFVLVVASHTYRERDDTSTGRREDELLKFRRYHDMDTGLRTILPVLLPGGDVDSLPDWLSSAGTVHRIRELTVSGAETLLRVLTSQPLERESPLGPVLPPRSSDGAERRDFFVSYTSADRGWAEWIAWQLEDAGYAVLLQAWDMVAGSNWLRLLNQATRFAERTILVLSDAYLADSKFGEPEWLAAYRRDPSGLAGRVIPVRVEDCTPDGLLAAIVYVDLVGVPDTATAKATLLNAIQAATAQRAKPISEPSFPGVSPPMNRAVVDTGLTTGRTTLPNPIRSTYLSLVRQIAPAQLIGREAERAAMTAFSTDAAAGSYMWWRAAAWTGKTALMSSWVLHPPPGAQVVAFFITARYAGNSDRAAFLDVITEQLATLLGQSLPFPTHPAAQERLYWSLLDQAAQHCLQSGQRLILLVDGLDGDSGASGPEAGSIAAMLPANPPSGMRVIVAGRIDWSIPDDVPSGHPLRDPEIVLLLRGEQPASHVTLADVFKPTGVPTITFVEPDEFAEFRLAVRQPGLGVVIEGPSGVGKTTMLRQGLGRDSVRVLSARDPDDLAMIEQVLSGHEGTVAIDDVHRLPADLQARLADYLKRLADRATDEKLILVGIPGTARHLIDFGADLATRIRVFRPSAVPGPVIQQMIEKGEAALNIRFSAKSEIAVAAAGSLLTAQTICWHLAGLAGIESTAPDIVTISSDLARAQARLAKHLDLKYGNAVRAFTMLDGPAETLCIELLLALRETNDGVLPLNDFTAEHQHLRDAASRVFGGQLAAGLGPEHADVSSHLHYDNRGQRIIADDPQFLFYLRQLNRAALMSDAGKRAATEQNQLFICYSHQETDWLERLLRHLGPLQRAGIVDVWSDRRIEIGADWHTEIGNAISRAKAAVLIISADMLYSDYVQNEELPRLLEAARQTGCRIIPLLAGPSLFAQTPSLSRFQATNSPDRTLSELPSAAAERVLVDLATSLIKLFGEKEGK